MDGVVVNKALMEYVPLLFSGHCEHCLEAGFCRPCLEDIGDKLLMLRSHLERWAELKQKIAELEALQPSLLVL